MILLLFLKLLYYFLQLSSFIEQFKKKIKKQYTVEIKIMIIIIKILKKSIILLSVQTYL